MSRAPSKTTAAEPQTDGKRRDSTKKPTGELFLSELAHAEQPNRELTVVTMSSAESMSSIFPNWVRMAYRRGQYEPFDMNMPPRLVPRKALHYKFDSPLTERGQIVAETYGRGLAQCGMNPFEIYCSPDMKAVQTAVFVIKGLGLSYTSINIEPALIGYRQLFPHNYQEMLLSSKVFLGLGYPINTQYVPYHGFFQSESIDDYNIRILSFFKDRIAKIEQKQVIVIGDNVMVELAANGQILTMDDILKCTKRPSLQMSTIVLKPQEAKSADSPVLPFTRSLFAARPGLWHEAPQKLSAPNHPEI
ncbi:unnamed protein product [Caenorhabditis sp. 36 PRJEB53466]|nr:unnamed protein product [Caenorhabditis sp. 36 PRJEB53466]